MSERMYTGETPEEFYARRAPLENIWAGCISGCRVQEIAPKSDEVKKNDKDQIDE